MSHPVNTEWRRWINISLGRGCASDLLINQMVAAGFDPKVANAAVLGAEVGADTELEGFRQEASLIPTANVLHLQDRTVRVAMRADGPDIVLLHGFLADQECDELMSQALPCLQPSTVVDLDQGGRKRHEARTSSGMAWKRAQDALLQRIEARIALLVGLPVERGEGIQALRYGVGGEYKPHHDYFPQDQAGSQLHLKNGGQRVATAIMYLNDVEEGGETVFPDIGLRVIPRKGALLYFSYRNSLGQTDGRALHGGAPVIRGEKWIATKWLREAVHDG